MRSRIGHEKQKMEGSGKCVEVEVAAGRGENDECSGRM